MTRKELTPYQSNLNLSVVALVALVVIVAFVGLVINSPPLVPVKYATAPFVDQAAPANLAGSAFLRYPPEACTPQCDGKSCGLDGCGGKCGVCMGGDVCDEYSQCVSSPCTCEGAGKSCGWAYLCGSVLQCGICTSDLTCDAGDCIPGPGPWVHPGWD